MSFDDYLPGSQKKTLQMQRVKPSRFSMVRLSTLGLAIIAGSIVVGTGLFSGRDSHVARAAGPELTRASDRADPRTNLKLAPREQIRLRPPNPDFLVKSVESPSRAAAPASLEAVDLRLDDGRVAFPSLPRFRSTHQGKVAGRTRKGELIYYSLDPSLQKYAEDIVAKTRTSHVAAVVMEPKTGRILAIAERSKTLRNAAMHAGFPAASLFKVVTAAAALERSTLRPLSSVRFRGGTYTLERWNYLPDKKRDKRVMNLSEAMGRSCNAVFGRVALLHLNAATLRSYASLFGFNDSIPSDYPLPMSTALIPDNDYLRSRTGAGFGEVTMSPMHAASFMSAIANDGVMPRPILVDKVVDPRRGSVYEAEPRPYKRVVRAETAKDLLRMMEYTTTIGTSRREFMYRNRPVLPGIRVAGKTGTLRGKNPKGINNWFIAAAPSHDPKVAVAVIVVDDKSITTKASRLGRMLIQKKLVK